MQLKKHSQSLQRIISYGIFGGLAFGIELLAFMLIAGVVPLFVAQSVSFICGLIISFFGNRLVTFKTSAYQHNARRQFTAYFTLACLNLLLANIAIYVLVYSLDLPLIVAKLATMVLITMWNFVIFQKLIFKSSV